jgi:hypothetical protein
MSGQSFPAWCADADQAARVPKAKPTVDTVGVPADAVAVPAKVPRVRLKVRPAPIDWRVMARQVEIAKRMDRLGIKQPTKHRKASVGSYTRKDSGRCHVVKR